VLKVQRSSATVKVMHNYIMRVFVMYSMANSDDERSVASKDVAKYDNRGSADCFRETFQRKISSSHIGTQLNQHLASGETGENPRINASGALPGIWSSRF
jgi:hypothetical protein